MPALDTRFPDTHDTLAADAPTDQALARSDTLLARTLASDRLPVPVASDPDTRTGGAARSPEQGEAPTTLGRYHVLERLGAGGMGVVFTAYDPDLDRKVAVKLLRADRSHESQVRLLREAQALARLSHPNVVQIHDAGVIGEQIFIAMEFVRGHDLRGWLTAQPRTPTEILRLFVDAGRGLAAAHAVGLIHRDFKPKSRRPSPNAPQPTDRPHFHDLGRFERVDVSRVVPRNAGAPQNLAKGWQRLGPADDARVLTPGLCVPVFLLQRREAESCVVDDVLIFQQAAVPSPGQVR